MKKLILIFTLLLLPSLTFSLSKEKIYKDLYRKFEKLESISFNFYSPNTGIEGSLAAEKGGKYKMTYGSQFIISDGKTIWNYQSDEETLLISNKESIGNAPSVEAFFFEFAEKYKPVSLNKVNNSSTGVFYKFALKQKERSDIITLENVILMLDKDLNIKSVIFDNGTTETEWQIKSLKVNPKLDESSFKFQAPDEASVIDMR